MRRRYFREMPRLEGKERNRGEGKGKENIESSAETEQRTDNEKGNEEAKDTKDGVALLEL